MIECWAHVGTTTHCFSLCHQLGLSLSKLRNLQINTNAIDVVSTWWNRTKLSNTFFFLFKINSQVPLEEVTPLLKCSPVVKPTSVIKYDLNRTLRGLGEGRECFCLGTLDYFTWEGIFSQAKTVSDWLLQPIISGLRKFLDWLISWEEAYGSP